MEKKDIDITLYQLIMNLKINDDYLGTLVCTDNESFPPEYRFQRELVANLFASICKDPKYEKWEDNPIFKRKIKSIGCKVSHYVRDKGYVLESVLKRDPCPETIDLKLVRLSADDNKGPVYQVISNKTIVVDGGERTYYPVIVITLKPEEKEDN